MTYKVVFTRQATRTLDRLARGDRHSARRIREATDALAADPRPNGAEALSGRDGYRLRVGSYRVVYVVDDAVRIVTIERIGHRGDVYRRM